MNADELYSGRFLNAADLKGKAWRLTIQSAALEQMPNGAKPKIGLTFTRGEKGLLLNKTNKDTIRDAYGPDTNQWPGKDLIVFPTKTPFNGSSVACIRLRIPDEVQPAVAPPPRQQPDGGLSDMANDLPDW